MGARFSDRFRMDESMGRVEVAQPKTTRKWWKIGAFVAAAFAVGYLVTPAPAAEFSPETDAYMTCWSTWVGYDAKPKVIQNLCEVKKAAAVKADGADYVDQVEQYMLTQYNDSEARTPEPEVEQHKFGAVGDQPACLSIMDVSRWYNLAGAGRIDLANKLSCMMVYESDTITMMSAVADVYEVIVERGTQTYTLWVSKYYFR